MPTVLCPECFEKGGKREEKTCTHGCWFATCAGCGKTRKVDERPFWHCVGDGPHSSEAAGGPVVFSSGQTVVVGTGDDRVVLMITGVPATPDGATRAHLTADDAEKVIQQLQAKVAVLRRAVT